MLTFGPIGGWLGWVDPGGGFTLVEYGIVSMWVKSEVKLVLTISKVGSSLTKLAIRFGWQKFNVEFGLISFGGGLSLARSSVKLCKVSLGLRWESNFIKFWSEFEYRSRLAKFVFRVGMIENKFCFLLAYI